MALSHRSPTGRLVGWDVADWLVGWDVAGWLVAFGALLAAPAGRTVAAPAGGWAGRGLGGRAGAWASWDSAVTAETKTHQAIHAMRLMSDSFRKALTALHYTCIG